MTNNDDAAVEAVALRDCPPGPFLFNGILGFKTEYNAMETIGPTDVPGSQIRWVVGNSPDVYVMASGEVFWGGAETRADRDGLLVTPVDVLPRATRDAEIERLREAAIDACASLVAAIYLLERGRRWAKKAAPSDKMFDQMLNDYRASLARARTALTGPPAPAE